MNEPTPFKVTTEDSISGVVTAIEEFTGTYGPSYNIDIDTGDGFPFRVKEKKDRVDRQFQERGLNRDTVVGRNIKLWKRPMPEDPKKGYLNIDLLDTGRASTPVAAPKPVPAKQEEVPGWLNKESKEGQIKEQARSDFDWAWNVAWGIMAPKVEGSGSSMGDPMVIQATQAAAIALVIRLEHTRR